MTRMKVCMVEDMYTKRQDYVYSVEDRHIKIQGRKKCVW